MEKRFGVKDFLLFAVLLMVLISIWLMMFQVDRQWEFISKVEKQREWLKAARLKAIWLAAKSKETWLEDLVQLDLNLSGKTAKWLLIAPWVRPFL